MTGTIWEWIIPALVAVGAITVWMAAPEHRRHPALRAALIISVAVVAIEAIITAFLFGIGAILFWYRGME